MMSSSFLSPKFPNFFGSIAETNNLENIKKKPAENTEIVSSIQELMKSLGILKLKSEVPPKKKTTATTTTADPVAEKLVEPSVDAVALQQLQDMGFKENRAKKALLLNKMNTQTAMEWLFEHEEDSDIDDPIPKVQLKQIAKEEASFVPDENIVEELASMGFPKEEIRNALRATNNNLEAATAWLLGDREQALQEDNFRIENNPIIEKILSDPQLQTSLQNPKVFQAFKSLVEDPESASQYLNDPEIGPILLQVHNAITKK